MLTDEDYRDIMFMILCVWYERSRYYKILAKFIYIRGNGLIPLLNKNNKVIAHKIKMAINNILDVEFECQVPYRRLKK